MGLERTRKVFHPLSSSSMGSSPPVKQRCEILTIKRRVLEKTSDNLMRKCAYVPDLGRSEAVGGTNMGRWVPTSKVSDSESDHEVPKVQRTSKVITLVRDHTLVAKNIRHTCDCRSPTLWRSQARTVWRVGASYKRNEVLFPVFSTDSDPRTNQRSISSKSVIEHARAARR